MQNLDISRSQLSRIFQMMSINSFGLGLVSVFIPIYLLKLGYSFSLVMIWMVVLHSSLLIFCFVTVWCSNRIGLVHCLQIRFALLISYLLLLFNLPATYPWYLFLIPVIMGAEAAFFWMPLNILFVRNTEHEAMGGAISKFFSYPQIFSMWSPLIGAFIISLFSFQILFGIAALIVFIGFFRLIPLTSEKTDFKFSWQSTKEVWSRNKHYFVPEVIDNFMEDAEVVLGIFIYLKLLSVTQIGIIGTLASIAVIMFTLTLGKLTDKWNKHKLLRIGAVLVSVTWAFNAYVGQFIPNQWLFYVATILLTLALKTFLVPYQSMLFNTARKDDAQFIILREIPTVLGRLILYSLAALLFNYLPILFFITGVIFIYFWFVNTKKLAGRETSDMLPS